MTRDDILSRFHHVKARGIDRFQACCPAHSDKHPSLSICFTKDGKVLLHCFAGCSTAEVLERVGLSFADLFDLR